MKATSWPRGTKTATDHLAGRSNCFAVKLTARNPKQPASEKLRALLCDATKKTLNESNRLFVLLLPEITTGST